ncbi:MAG: PPK2 family polyphosphate kinase [Myxococcota bacterium]
MFDAPASPYRASGKGRFDLASARTSPPSGAPGKDELERQLQVSVARIAKLQERFYATDQAALLLVFQAMDAAGKDGTIKAVLSGVNPAGCQVSSFKAPSDQELDHDFLWRHGMCLPERGRIGVFNRSWYEEVLVVRVHPEYLDRQRLPWRAQGEELWEQRLESIADFERHLARNGTAVLKFFLHVGKDEQYKRLEARIEDPEKNWKVEPGDAAERRYWDEYQAAYTHAIGATHTSWAPWYVIPADDKRYMRAEVARIVAEALASLPLDPQLDPATSTKLAEARRLLREERG